MGVFTTVGVDETFDSVKRHWMVDSDNQTRVFLRTDPELVKLTVLEFIRILTIDPNSTKISSLRMMLQIS